MDKKLLVELGLEVDDEKPDEVVDPVAKKKEIERKAALLEQWDKRNLTREEILFAEANNMSNILEQVEKEKKEKGEDLSNNDNWNCQPSTSQQSFTSWVDEPETEKCRPLSFDLEEFDKSIREVFDDFERKRDKFEEEKKRKILEEELMQESDSPFSQSYNNDEKTKGAYNAPNDTQEKSKKGKSGKQIATNKKGRQNLHKKGEKRQTRREKRLRKCESQAKDENSSDLKKGRMSIEELEATCPDLVENARRKLAAFQAAAAERAAAEAEAAARAASKPARDFERAEFLANIQLMMPHMDDLNWPRIIDYLKLTIMQEQLRRDIKAFQERSVKKIVEAILACARSRLDEPTDREPPSKASLHCIFCSTTGTRGKCILRRKRSKSAPPNILCWTPRNEMEKNVPVRSRSVDILRALDPPEKPVPEKKEALKRRHSSSFGSPHNTQRLRKFSQD